MMLHHLKIQHLPAPFRRFLPAEIDRNQSLRTAEIALPHWLTVVLFFYLFCLVLLDEVGPYFIYLVDAAVVIVLVVIILFVD